MLEEKSMEEWLGEISIEKSLQEIKEMLVKLSNDVDKIYQYPLNFGLQIPTICRCPSYLLLELYKLYRREKK